MTMRFVYIRHGKKADPGGDGAPLTEKGREQARKAGEFLKAERIEPDWLCTTPAKRTKETAEIVLEAIGIQCPARKPEPGWTIDASIDEIGKRIAKWASDAPHPVKTLLFVGHKVQQDALVRAFGFSPIPKDNKACVLVLERDKAGVWRRGAWFAGTP